MNPEILKPPDVFKDSCWSGFTYNSMTACTTVNQGTPCVMEHMLPSLFIQFLFLIQHRPDFGGQVFSGEWLLDKMHIFIQYTMLSDDISCIA